MRYPIFALSKLNQDLNVGDIVKIIFNNLFLELEIAIIASWLSAVRPTMTTAAVSTIVTSIFELF